MSNVRIGTKQGSLRRATILKYNGDGTVLIGIDHLTTQQSRQFTVSIPASWMGPNGEFAGGYPIRGATVIVEQLQGGDWAIVSLVNSNGVFSNKNLFTSSSASNNLMSALRPDRYLIQVKGGNRLFLDPNDGAQIGQASNFIHIDPNRSIISDNFRNSLKFTEAGRTIDGIVKRDLAENSNRNVLGSTLTSHIYDDTLTTIGMDPTLPTIVSTAGERLRNAPFVERRELVYEFADSFGILTDTDESEAITGEIAKSSPPQVNRNNSRANLLSLGLHNPNHLIETVQGTLIDSFGNILDLNRNPLPVGKLDEISLKNSSDKTTAYAKIRAEERKSIAYHFEINTRKAGKDQDSAVTPPDPTDKSDYARDRSKFFFDVDKEGQIKLNVPASSETGNIPLLTRYENYSVLLAKQDNSYNPNEFVRNETFQDIFIEDFSGKPAITLSASEHTLDGYAAPIDRFTSSPIKLGTAFHDITKTCSSFLKDRGLLINYDETNLLNKVKQLDYIVTENIIISGEKANGGGRSGSFHFDGFVSLNLGANTVDRQSLWVDFAGGMVGNVGRDRQGISSAMNYHGDVFIEIGGVGVGNSYDSRFADLNDASRSGTLDIRVKKSDGQLTIVRIDELGASIVTYGRLLLMSEQDMVFKTNARMHLNAEQIFCYSNTGTPREILRKALTI